jgi:carbonic anhydrase/acetyltransferase-like protein (isoleucine patch superfamily)
VFIATGVSIFPGARAGAGSELRINSVLHVKSRLEQDTVLPIGWVAVGDPAQLFSPDRGTKRSGRCSRSSTSQEPCMAWTAGHP